MPAHVHSLSVLFAQLGLPEHPADVAAFIRSHRPLSRHLRLAEAPFWSPIQAELLTRSVADDADWCEVVDTLDSLLRHGARPGSINPPAGAAGQRQQPAAG